jgi:hypothetical protein
VRGGKSHALVVDVLGLLTGYQGQAHHSVLVDTDQAAGLTDAAALLQMLEDRESFVVGKLTAVEGRAFAFGEAFLAGTAGEDPAFLLGTVAEADAEVVQATATVVGTLGILAAKGFQVVHRGSSRSQARQKVDKQLGLA